MFRWFSPEDLAVFKNNMQLGAIATGAGKICRFGWLSRQNLDEPALAGDEILRLIKGVTARLPRPAEILAVLGPQQADRRATGRGLRSVRRLRARRDEQRRGARLFL